MADEHKTPAESGSGAGQGAGQPSRAWMELTARYLRDLPQQVYQMKMSVEAGDYAAVRKQAHRIRGTSGTYRLGSIYQAAARLEQVVTRRNPKAIATSVDEIRSLVEQESTRVNLLLLELGESGERRADGRFGADCAGG